METEKNVTEKLPGIDRRFIWIGLGLFSLFIRWLLSFNPLFTEIAYSRGVFIVLRWIMDCTIGFLPFPAIYLMAFFLLTWAVWKWWKGRVKRRSQKFLQRIASAVLNLLAIGSAGVFFFLLLWGYNYQQFPVESRLGFEVDSLTQSQIREELFLATEAVVAAREMISTDTIALGSEMLAPDLESVMRDHLVEVLTENNYPTPGKVRGWRLFPKGLLMRLGASGIYIPYVGQGHIDPGLHPLTQPSTLAHELAHGYGFGNEGSCNFWAYLACEKSDDPFIRYAGLLDYWIEVASLYRRNEPEAYANFRETLPKGMIEDLRAIRAAIDQYSSFFPQFNRVFYDAFLKSQGVEEGIVSYSRVVSMVIALRNQRAATR